MVVAVRVGIRSEYDDVKGEGRKNYIEKNLGIPVNRISSRHLYVIEGIGPEDAKTAAEKLLADKVVEYFEVFEVDDIFEEPNMPDGFEGSWTVRVGYKIKPLVLDAWGDTTKKALEDLGIETESLRHLEEYLIDGALTEERIKMICEEKLYDEKVQQFVCIPVGVESNA